MRHHLCQVVLAGEVLIHEEVDLTRGVGVRIGPAAQRQPRDTSSDLGAQLPRVLDAARTANGLVAAEHDERAEPVLRGLLRVRQAEIERVFAREKRDHVVARHVAPHVRDEVTKIVLLLRSHGAVGQEDAGTLTGEAAHGVIRVDPRVHAVDRVELGARRTQLRGDDRDVSAHGFG
jgi:hypothetical protein